MCGLLIEIRPFLPNWHLHNVEFKSLGERESKDGYALECAPSSTIAKEKTRRRARSSQVIIQPRIKGSE